MHSGRATRVCPRRPQGENMASIKNLVTQRDALRVELRLQKRRGDGAKVKELEADLAAIKRLIAESGATAMEVVDAAQPTDVQFQEQFDYERPHWETRHGRHRI